MVEKVMNLCYKIHLLAAIGGCSPEQKKEIEENLTPIVKDLSQPEEEVKAEQVQEVKTEIVQEFKQQVLVNDFDLDDDDDMPF